MKLPLWESKDRSLSSLFMWLGDPRPRTRRWDSCLFMVQHYIIINDELRNAYSDIVNNGRKYA